MRIGIDIDGCLTDEDEYRLAYVFKYCYEQGLDTPDDPYGYEYKASWWNHDRESDYRRHYMENYFLNVAPRYCCKEVIDRLRSEGHEIYLITGRYPGFFDTPEGARVRDLTRQWLAKNEIAHDKLVFTGFPKTKYIKAEGVDIMMEDFDETIKDCVKEFTTFCYDNHYNHDYESENMVRVYSWYDFYRKFHEMYD